MQRYMAMTLWIVSVSAAAALFSGCRAPQKETVSVKLVSIEPKPTTKGVKLAVTYKPTLAYLETIERSPNVKSVTRVTNNEDKALQIGTASVSPIGDTLVYQVFIEEQGGSSYSNIWTQAVGSPARTRATYGKALDLFPTFTPDGDNLIFSSNRAGKNATLWLIKYEGGGGLTRITSTSPEDYSPSVSPDGNLIAYASNLPEANAPQIWTININGSLPTQLREGEAPRISPDGQKILFARNARDTEKKQIWIMNIEGSQETQITQNTEYDAIDTNWSPDGRWIVFSSDEAVDSEKRQNFDIWMMASDGTKKTQLTTNGSRDDSPCWDRSGKYVYFRSNRGGAWNIWRFEPVMP